MMRVDVVGRQAGIGQRGARRPSAARSEVVWPSAAKWRRSIPVRERIHSSEVSSVASNSAFGTTRSGR